MNARHRVLPKSVSSPVKKKGKFPVPSVELAIVLRRQSLRVNRCPPRGNTAAIINSNRNSHCSRTAYPQCLPPARLAARRSRMLRDSSAPVRDITSSFEYSTLTSTRNGWYCRTRRVPSCTTCLLRQPLIHLPDPCISLGRHRREALDEQPDQDRQRYGTQLCRLPRDCECALQPQVCLALPRPRLCCWIQGWFMRGNQHLPCAHVLVDRFSRGYTSTVASRSLGTTLLSTMARTLSRPLARRPAKPSCILQREGKRWSPGPLA